jgi:PTS system nitrogen regulatory IIA component
MEEEILTIEEVARYLRVSERTVYDWAQKGEIPSGKIGTVWRFKRTDIERWVNERLSSNRIGGERAPLDVRSLISQERIVFLPQSTKRDALVLLADTLAKAPQVKNKQDLVEELLKREELMSTSIGKGIAIPHVRLNSVTDLVMAIGISKEPIEGFATLDDEPVRLLFMIAAAYNQHAYYLQTISWFSSRLRSHELREALLAAESKDEVYRLLTSHEA